MAEVFEALRGVSAADRAGALDTACSGDAILRAEVEELLRHHDSESAVLSEDASDAPSATPTEVEGYQLLEPIGEGGMGAVFRAQPTGGGEVVAIKLLHPHLVRTGTHRDRFLREAQIGAGVQHPGVVRVLDARADEGDAHAPFLVMEYVEGQPLQSLSEELGQVPEELCRQLGRDIASALGAIHAAGAVHREVKPANVLVTPDHTVKLLDLGVARVIDATHELSRTGAFVGSLHYASPEQFSAEQAVDGRADLHALGIVLYELSSGTHLFRGDDVATVVRSVLTTVPRRLGEINPGVSRFFEEVVHTLLAKDPDKRVQTAEELCRLFDDGEESAWWTQRRARLGERLAARRRRAPAATALHGRDNSSAALDAAFAAAQRGDGGVVLVQGEPGIGKSRLLDELALRLERAGTEFDWLFGGYPPFGAAMANGAVVSALRDHFGADAVERSLSALLPGSLSLVRSISALVRGLPPPDDATPLTPDSLAAVVVGALRGLARIRPVVLVVEDLHFAPQEGRALFQALALGARGHRIVLLGTTRPGLPERWLSGLDRLQHVSRVTLSRLGPRDLRELLVEAFHSERLADELGWRLARTSDGNPFFVFEIIRTLRESGLLHRGDDGSWSTTGIIERIELPASVKDIFETRLAALDESDQEILDVAACCGFEFDPLLVTEALGQARIPVLRALGRIEQRHALVHAAGPRFVFDHHQVQELLYERLSPALRREYHAVLGDALERRALAESVTPAEVWGATAAKLASHFLEAESGVRAVPYLTAALEHLEPRSRDEAARLGHRALGAGTALQGAARLPIQRRVSASLEHLGRTDERDAMLAEALQLANDLGDRKSATDILAQRGWSLVMRGSPAEAIEVLASALEAARELGDQRLESAIEGHLGAASGYLGDNETAAQHQHAALAIAREIGDRKLEAKACGGLGVAMWTLGDFTAALEWDERALAISREVGDVRYAAVALGNLAGSYTAAGMYARSMELQDERLRLAREIGYRRGEAIGLGNLALALAVMGRFDEACEMHERQIALSEDVAYRRGVAHALGGTTIARTYQGRYADAERSALEAIEIARECGAKDLEAAAEQALGDCLNALGREEEAAAHLARAHELGDASGLANESTISLLLRAAAGEESVASEARASHERYRDRMGYRVRMHAEHLMWRVTGEREHLDEAWRRLQFLRDNAPAEYRESLMRDQPMHRAIAEDVSAAAGS